MLRLKMLLLLSLVSSLLYSCSYPVRTTCGPPMQNIPQDSYPTDTATGEEQSATDIETHKKPIKKKAENNEQEIIDEALDLLGQSQDFWEEGDLDNALKSLDKAYGLILDVNGDLDISRQKDDLRFLISKRILEIYASRHTVAKGNGSEIPLDMNEDIKKEIRIFQNSERNFFIRAYQRSGRYRPGILEHLKKAGLPEELSWLPLVESGFKIKALSRARALGLWQFIPSTGYKFGLKRDRWVDERMDVGKSTEAAIAYLKELHEIFGDWMTVLAAYNCGEGRVLKVISRQHVNYLDNFWDLYRMLPHETARYVPRFLATLHIIKDPDKYGMDLSDNAEKPIPYELVKTNKCMRLQDIALYLNISKKSLTSLNPVLRYKLTPDREYDLKVPPGMTGRFNLVADKIPQWKSPSRAFVRHRIRRGESLSVIAKKYRSSVRAIMAYNNLRSKHRIREGQRLKIPIRGYGYVQPTTKKRVKVSKLSAGKIINYRVKQGDSLWSLARRFDTTVSKIKWINNLNGSELQIGQIIRIKSCTATKTYMVRQGDNPNRIARKYKINLRSLLKMNNLSRTDKIYPGQIIIVER